MTVKTIGTTSRDYSTVQAWEDACPNLVSTTQTWIGECYNDSVLTGFTASGNTTSATYYLQLKCASGQSFKDHANKLTNALKYNSSNGVALYGTPSYAVMIYVDQTYFSMQDLQIRCAHGSGATRTVDVSSSSTNFTISNSIVENQGDDLCLQMRASTQKAVNCLFIKSTTNGTSGGAVAAQGQSKLFSCTVVKTSDAADSGTGISSYNGDARVTNTAVFGFTTAMQSSGFDASTNYNGTDQAPADSGPNDQDNLTYANQFENTTNASFDFRVKSGSGLINNGTRDQTNTNDLDIIGQSRSTTTPTIGCWEFVSGGGATAYYKSIAGSCTPIGTPTKKTKRTFVSSFTPTASANKHSKRGGLAGSITPVGSLSLKLVFLRAIGGSITPSGTVGKFPKKVLQGVITASGSLVKKSTKTLVGSLTPYGGLIKKLQRTLQGVITPTATYTSRFITSKSISGSTSPNGSVNGVWAAAPVGGAGRNIIKHLMRLVGK